MELLELAQGVLVGLSLGGSAGAIEQLGYQTLRQPDRLILIPRLDAGIAFLSGENRELGCRVANELGRENWLIGHVIDYISDRQLLANSFGYRVHALSSTLAIIDCSKCLFSQPTNNGRSQEQNAARGGFVDVLRLIAAVPIRLVTDGS